MIREAQSAGADLVKFQLYDAKDDRGKPHYPYSKQAELSLVQAGTLYWYGFHLGIEVFFSVFASKYVGWCELIGVKRYKIAHSMNHNADLLKSVRATKKPLIMSESLPNLVRDYTSLFCVSEYPTLKVILPDFNLYDGLSDHSKGIEITKIAIARGARIIEKHFCIEDDCYEREWSITPAELRELKEWEVICLDSVKSLSTSGIQG